MTGGQMTIFSTVLFAIHTVLVIAMIVETCRWIDEYKTALRWNKEIRRPGLASMWMSTIALIISWAQLWFVIARC